MHLVGMRNNYYVTDNLTAVMSMYTCAKTVVRTVCGNSNCFEVEVGMHQGSALSPSLFVIVMEALSGEFRVTCISSETVFVYLHVHLICALSLLTYLTMGVVVCG